MAMAMAMDNLVSWLYEVLISSDHKLQEGTREEIRFLLREIQMIQSFVLDMTENQLDEQDKIWYKELVKMSYNIQSIFDNLDHQLRTAGSTGGLIGGRMGLMRGHKISRQIVAGVRNAKDLICESMNRRERYHIDSILVGSSCHRRRHAIAVAGLPVQLGNYMAEMVKITEEARGRLQALVVDADDGNNNNNKTSSNILVPCWLRDKIRLLQGEVEWMHTTLSLIATSVPVEELDEGTKAWAEDMREVCCDIKDTVDSFRERIGVGTLRRKAGLKGLIARTRAAGACREFAAAIIDLKKSILEVTERRRRYPALDYVAWRRNYSSGDDDDDNAVIAAAIDPTDQLVGVDGPMSVLIRRLTHTDEGKPQLKVASIVGTAGVGKTTLARAIYHRLLPEFDSTAWVSLSVNPDLRRVLTDLLRQILSQQDKHEGHFGASSVGELIDQIREALRNKRYFVVFDDIWNLSLWEEAIKFSLIENGNGSAVLTTSHKVHVAEGVGGIYALAPLSESYSRELFYGRLYRSEDTCTPELKDISGKILGKCDGIPLAIVATADLLGSGRAVKDWQAVHERFGYELQRGPYNVRRIISTSYNDLPAYLKPCLLYFGMFPRGYEISGYRLIWGWIAQGFMRITEGETLQEVGENWLDELIDRNLVELVEVDVDGKSCRVYGLVHDLIISLSTEENFATIFYGQQGRSLGDTVYRLSIQGNKVEHSVPDVGASLSNVWSLVVSGHANLMPSLSKFKNLRIMDLGGCESLQNEHLNDIGRLFLLTYLVLRGTCITDIPKEVGGLTCLETLDLRGTGIEELPESIVQLRKLKRLYLDSCTKVPNGIGKLEALEELGDISITESMVLKEVCKLIHLRVLRIAIWSWDESYDDSSLLKYLRLLVTGRQQIQSLSIISSSSLHFLEKLDAEWSNLKKLEIRHSTFVKLPAWLCSVQNLTTLSIEVYELSRDIVDMLGKMNNLLSLFLTSKHAPEGTEQRSVIGASGFSKLTSFHLFSNAMGKLFEPGTMHKLNTLKLSFEASRTKDAYKCFDFGLENLSSLKHVHVDIICFDASLKLVEDAEFEIKSAVSRYCSCQPNLKIQRVQEEDIMKNEVQDIKNEVEDQLTNDIKQEQQQKEIKKKKRKKKGVSRKYKIVSLQLKRQILTLRDL
ncbi:hypothetical protein E2562_026746 [Oryza meyeriana var. granulata]|uniref:AAA+ ATPase domain-containing protein n=1 Tax=Oryza meyeriana var. granulata TaxID=110450 RepID=A0A6G1C9C2_9ORYZ|nr:hypothetical protein E2562_026746 [Oryza meyeriana var. granulata]